MLRPTSTSVIKQNGATFGWNPAGEAAYKFLPAQHANTIERLANDVTDALTDRSSAFLEAAALGGGAAGGTASEQIGVGEGFSGYQSGTAPNTATHFLLEAVFNGNTGDGSASQYVIMPKWPYDSDGLVFSNSTTNSSQATNFENLASNVAAATIFHAQHAAMVEGSFGFNMTPVLQADVDYLRAPALEGRLSMKLQLQYSWAILALYLESLLVKVDGAFKTISEQHGTRWPLSAIVSPSAFAALEITHVPFIAAVYRYSNIILTS